MSEVITAVQFLADANAELDRATAYRDARAAELVAIFGIDPSPIFAMTDEAKRRGELMDSLLEQARAVILPGP